MNVVTINMYFNMFFRYILYNNILILRPFFIPIYFVFVLLSIIILLLCPFA